MKPILFNTKMVRAILDNRKTVTRRVVKRSSLGRFVIDNNREVIGSLYHNAKACIVYPSIDDCPYQPGDILYVRETWAPLYPDMISNGVCGYIYRADPLSVENYDSRFPDGKDYQWEGKWRPSIHMPREAARIFLQVTDVRVERLQDITDDGVEKEGVPIFGRPEKEARCLQAFSRYRKEWDSTIKPKDRALYGWEADPWVWVIEFERCDNLEEGK